MIGWLLLGIACTDIRDVPVSELSELSPGLVGLRLTAEHGTGANEGSGPHRFTASLSLQGLPCTRLSERVEVRFNGAPASWAYRGPPTARGEQCSDEGLAHPSFSLEDIERTLDTDLDIVLTDGDVTWSVLVHLASVPPLPVIDQVRAVAPAELASVASGFQDAQGRLVIYPEVSYRVEMDQPWVEPTRSNDALEQVERAFTGEIRRLEDYAFQGSELAIGPKDFALQTRHLLSLECSTDDDDCATVSGFRGAIVTGHRWIHDVNPQMPMAWAKLGTLDNLCRIDGSCDAGTTCEERVCLAMP